MDVDARPQTGGGYGMTVDRGGRRSTSLADLGDRKARGTVGPAAATPSSSGGRCRFDVTLRDVEDGAFWRIIATACRSDPTSVEAWNDGLTDRLAKLPADAIEAWDRRFCVLAGRAYRTDLWAAAHLINGGAASGGFYSFRCWLIGMGQQVYEAALADPDSLADVVRASWDPRGIDAEAEIYGAAREAWLRVTGAESDDYPVCETTEKLGGSEWDYEDVVRMERELPRLFSIVAQT